MRRAAILLLLLLAMQLILPLGVGERSTSLLTFGFLILAAHTVGEVAAAWRLPKIVGYLAAGILFGPSLLGTVSAAAVAELAPVSRLAIALIAFLAGAELQWGEVKERGVAIVKIMGAELLLCFAAVFTLLLAARGAVPFLRDAPPAQAAAFAVLFAAVAIIHSPAVTMALLSETGARGPVARTSLGVVLLSDVAVIILFSGALAVARTIAPPPGDAGGSSGWLVLWEIGGSVIVGAALGALVALYLRFVRRELLLFAILVTLAGAELTRLLHVETLLTLLTAGFVSENGSRYGTELRHAVERAAAPVFVVFFALAGASMGLREVIELWPIVLPIVAVRALAIWLGSRLGARWAGVGDVERRYVWTALISQAGVAIGLATIVAGVYPQVGAQMRTLFLAVMTINQLAGPILNRWGLNRAGEVQQGE
ncbi:MAG TPA: cation:proton antiporter [Gemmatimonadaceae bacterium]|nr:cation:proton antiporter [Gemmatimonadaceae bacterium]